MTAPNVNDHGDGVLRTDVLADFGPWLEAFAARTPARRATVVVPGWLIDRCAEQGLNAVAFLDDLARRYGFAEGANVRRLEGTDEPAFDAAAWEARIDAVAAATGEPPLAVRRALRNLLAASQAAADMTDAMERVTEAMTAAGSAVAALAEQARGMAARAKPPAPCPRHGPVTKGGFCRRCNR